ncbi:peptidoglycan DD-metalloendopeptidase family protein [Patescibacteria group bacterium]|nr:peptidoglycan DD-metalloendopeptidase family protein [Patescibacteria group bacterium]
MFRILLALVSLSCFLSQSVFAYDQLYADPVFMKSGYWVTGYEFDEYVDDWGIHVGEDAKSNVGEPVYAIGPGKVMYADFPGVSSRWGHLVIIEHQLPDDTNICTGYAHLGSDLRVHSGQTVSGGEILGLIGAEYSQENGYWPVHLHALVYNGAYPVSQGEYAGTYIHGYEGSTDGYQSPLQTMIDVRVDFPHHGNDIEEVFGGKNGDVHWYHQYNQYDVYHPDNTPKNCYIQEFNGGSQYNGAVVYDPVGGARKSYIIGWWQWNAWKDLALNCGSCPHPDGHEGASGEGGPNSCLGMPITNSYWSGSNWRQDFQKGYIQGDQVWCYNDWFVGWGEDGKWHADYSYLFAEAYERNGCAPIVGNPFANESSPVQVHYWNGFLTQDVNGGSNGWGVIMYDSQNWVGNVCATNEAYYMYGVIWEYYKINGSVDLFGCPTTDQYDLGDLTVQDFHNRHTDTYWRIKSNWSDEPLDACGQSEAQGGDDPVIVCLSDDPGSFIGNGGFNGQGCWDDESPNHPEIIFNYNNLFESHVNGPFTWYEVTLSQDWVWLDAGSDCELIWIGSVNAPSRVIVGIEYENGEHVLWEEVWLTPTNQQFVMPFWSQVTDAAGKLVFYLGEVDQSVWIRDVVVRYTEAPPPPPPPCAEDDAGSFIGNGQFYGQGCWDTSSPSHPEIIYNYYGTFESHINGPFPWYDVKLSQDWVWLEAGSVCEVTWKGSANSSSLVTVAIEYADGTNVLWEEAWLTPTEQQFDMTFWPQVADPAGKLIFYLGAVDQSVWIKDVVVRYAEPEPVCSGDDPNSFIGNGQFNSSGCWTTEHYNLPYVVTNFNGQFEGHINGPYEWYEVPLSQDWVYLTANSDLEVIFTGAVNAPSTVVVSVEDSNGNHLLWEEVALTSTEERFTLPFRSNVTDPNGKLTFYLGWVDQSVWLKDVVVRFAEAPGAVTVGALLTVSPNPASKDAAVSVLFNLAKESPVAVEIFDVTGRMISGLINETMAKGQHVVTWDGRSETGSSVTSGIYFVKIEGDNVRNLQRLIIVH